MREFWGGVSVYDKEEEQGKVEDGEVGGEEVWWVAPRGGVSLHSRLLALPLENCGIINLSCKIDPNYWPFFICFVILRADNSAFI